MNIKNKTGLSFLTLALIAGAFIAVCGFGPCVVDNPFDDKETDGTNCWDACGPVPCK